MTGIRRTRTLKMGIRASGTKMSTPRGPRGSDTRKEQES